MKWKVLDLFCGAGGAAVGLKRAWPDAEIIGVDINPQKHYPFTFVQADAMDLPFDLRYFDFIWASPPCQGYMTLNDLNAARFDRRLEHPHLIEPVTKMLVRWGGDWVLENVQGAPMETQVILCGASFGLAPLARHRHFASNVMLFAPPCSHRGKGTVGVYGRLQPRWVKKTVDGRVSTRTASTIVEARQLMGIDWMDWDELREAVPPVYSEFIARQIRPCPAVGAAGDGAADRTGQRSE